MSRIYIYCMYVVPTKVRIMTKACEFFCYCCYPPSLAQEFHNDKPVQGAAGFYFNSVSRTPARAHVRWPAPPHNSALKKFDPEILSRPAQIFPALVCANDNFVELIGLSYPY
jgi:hypothetical protein